MKTPGRISEYQPYLIQTLRGIFRQWIQINLWKDDIRLNADFLCNTLSPVFKFLQPPEHRFIRAPDQLPCNQRSFDPAPGCSQDLASPQSDLFRTQTNACQV